jgi:hypothetical protein
MNTLPNDFARCNGSGSDAEGWREGCETCLRRTAPRLGRSVMITPPPIIAFECEYLIEPNVEPWHRCRQVNYDRPKNDE